jgi:hypothetical protein
MLLISEFFSFLVVLGFELSLRHARQVLQLEPLHQPNLCMFYELKDLHIATL